MKLLAAVLIFPFLAIAQDAPASSAAAVTTPGPGRIVCTPADAEKYEGYNQLQCIQLGDIALIGACNQCRIDGKRTKDRNQREISNMLREQEAAGVEADCDEGADAFFDNKGIFYDQASKEAWTRQCNEQLGGVIKTHEISAPITFDFKTPDFRQMFSNIMKGGSDDAADSKSSVASWSRLWQKISGALGGALVSAIISAACYYVRQQLPAPGGATPAAPQPMKAVLLVGWLFFAFMFSLFMGSASKILLVHINS